MPPRLFDAQHRAITIGIVCTVTLVAFEGTAVITALPTVARDLGQVPLFAWIINAFVAASLIGQVMAGEWADRLGPRIPMLAAITAFGLGGLTCGLAQTFGVLLGGRALQGLGAGALIVIAYVIIGRAYDVRLRSKAFALLSASWVLPAIVGPVVAGWVTETYSWRYVFLIVAVIIWIPVFLVVPKLRVYDGAVSQAPARTGRTALGVAAAAGLILFQDGVQRHGLVGGAEAVLAFVVLIPSLKRLLPAGSLRLARGLPTVVVMRGLLAGAFFSAEAWIPLALSTVRSVSTTWAGLFLAVGAIGWAAGAWFQGHPPANWTPARFVQLGAACVVVALVTLPLSMVPALPPWVLGISWLIAAMGMGMAVSSLALLLLNYSEADEQGANSASLQVSDSTGVVLATGATGALFAAASVMGEPGAGVFVAMWWMSAAVAVVALWASPRVSRRAIASAR
jgi:MFS family permease